MRMELPPEFIRRVQEQLREEAQAFLEAHHFTVPISILNNPKKPASLNHERESQVPWNSFGAYLKERPAFIRDPLVSCGSILFPRSFIHGDNASTRTVPI